jgi:hypothetical protein
VVALLLQRGAEIEARNDVRRCAGDSVSMHLCMYVPVNVCMLL